MRHPIKQTALGKNYYMIDNQIIVKCTISYKFKNAKMSMSSSVDHSQLMINGLIRDGATNVHIEHYYNSLGRMIK